MSTKEKAALIETLWPTIQEANRQNPTHAKISKPHILFTSPGKPILRTGKGTLQRKSTVQSYSEELDALYADADSMNDLEVPVFIDTNDMEGSILQILKTATTIPDLATEDDFFSRGNGFITSHTDSSLTESRTGEGWRGCKSSRAQYDLHESNGSTTSKCN